MFKVPDQTIRVLYMPDIRSMQETTIENTLEALQKAVNGYIEIVPNGDGTVTVCNKYRLIIGMPPNRRAGRKFIFGPFLICGAVGEELRSLTDKELKKYKKLMSQELEKRRYFRVMYKWNWDRCEKEPILVPAEWNCPEYTEDDSEVVNCLSCGRLLCARDGYTSMEIQSPAGMGYIVCKDCHTAEVQRKMEARENV